MPVAQYVLKSDVVVEPLISRWYAWAHMIGPATACLNLAYRYLPLMDSFISSPSAHAAACQDPKMRGGPFMNLPVSQVDDVKALITATKQQGEMIEFGMGLREALRMLMKQADGFSIEKFYSELPDSIKGYVELSYTLTGAPDLRVIEPLLYKKGFSGAENQSAMIYRVNGEDRSFAYSTPRLPIPDSIELRQPFSSEIYDFLAKLRTTPKTLPEITSSLGIEDHQTALLQTLLTEHIPSAPSTVLSGRTRWRYFGHACVLVESPSGRNILVDPLIAYDDNCNVPRFTLSDLPDHIDTVVLTHNHSDHVVIETLLAIRHKVGKIVVPSSGGALVDPSLKLMLESIGFNNVVALDTFEKIVQDDLTLTALPFLGEHGDLDIRSKTAWLVKSADDSLLFAADSNNLEPKLYDLIRELYGSITTLFLGMECLGAPFSWVYGPYLPTAIDRKKDQSRRLNGSDFHRGVEVIKSLGCKNVYIYAMGAEPWLQFITSIDPAEDTIPAVNAKQLMEYCRAQGIYAERLFGTADVTLS